MDTEVAVHAVNLPPLPPPSVRREYISDITCVEVCYSFCLR